MASIPALQTRSATVAPKSLNPEARTIDLIWSTGARVLRGFFDKFFEELSLDPKHVRMGRLASGRAPVLAAHDGRDLDAVVGVVERARLEGSQGAATVRFADAPKSDGVFRKIATGIGGVPDSRTTLERAVSATWVDSPPKGTTESNAERRGKLNNVLSQGPGGVDTGRVELRLLREFKRQYHQFSHHLPDSEDTMEWMSLMRHYGAPCRLVDFSYSWFVALFFAIENSRKEAEIWAVNAFRQGALARRYTVVAEEHARVTLPLPKSREVLYASLGARMKGNVNNLKNRLERAGLAPELVVAESPADPDRHLDVLFELHRRRAYTDKARHIPTGSSRGSTETPCARSLTGSPREDRSGSAS